MTRLDRFLVDAGHFPSRERARAAIEAGLVKVGGVVALKPATKAGPDHDVEVCGDVHPYVSRGGVKLEAALSAFDIDPAGLLCLDLGASTGGFCDVLLRRDAQKIYAVDVGSGQLHSSLRDHPRIINLEKTHAKDLSSALIPEPVSLIVCDVSFISLKKALPAALALGGSGAMLAALVKPQFEVGRTQIGRGGIVKPSHENSAGVAEDIANWLSDDQGWAPLGYIESPVTGGDGNKEYLIGARKTT